MTILTKEQLESFAALGGQDAKNALADFAEANGVDTKRNKSFNNILNDIKESGIIVVEEDDGLQPEYLNEVEELSVEEDIQEPEQEAEFEEVQEGSEEFEVEYYGEPVSYEEVQEEAQEEMHKEESSSLLPENFEPHFNLLGPAPGYYSIPYWIFKWIIDNDDWKANIQEFPNPFAWQTLYSLVYYIERDGSVQVKDSKDNKFHTLR